MLNLNDTQWKINNSSKQFHDMEKEEQINIMAEEAQRHITENNFGIAFEIYERILEIDSLNCDQKKDLLYEMAQITYDLLWNFSGAMKYLCRCLEIDPHCSKAKSLKDIADSKLKDKISCFKQKNEANEDLQRNWGRFDKSFESAVPNIINQKIVAKGKTINTPEASKEVKKPTPSDSTAMSSSVTRIEMPSKFCKTPILDKHFKTHQTLPFPKVVDSHHQLSKPITGESETLMNIPEASTIYAKPTISNYSTSQQSNQPNVLKQIDVLYETVIKFETPRVEASFMKESQTPLKITEPSPTTPPNFDFSASQQSNQQSVQNQSDALFDTHYKVTQTGKAIDEKIQKQIKKVSNTKHSNNKARKAPAARTSVHKNYKETPYRRHSSRTSVFDVTPREDRRNINVHGINKQNTSWAADQKEGGNQAKDKTKFTCVII